MKKIIIFVFSIFILLSICTVSAKANVESDDSKVILIDPGHGGIDGGAQSKNGTIEKDINLQIATKLKEKLVSKGYTVYMTRDEDEGLYQKGSTIREKKRDDLKRRTEMKIETNCDIFVSIHQNMFAQSKCYGAQVWYASNDKSSTLANIVQDSLKETIKDNNKRVAKPAGEAYLILRDKFDGASILVECGFLSNPEEEVKLKSEEHQNLIVDGISFGIDRYFNENSNNTNDNSN